MSEWRSRGVAFVDAAGEFRSVTFGSASAFNNWLTELAREEKLCVALISDTAEQALFDANASLDFWEATADPKWIEFARRDRDAAAEAAGLLQTVFTAWVAALRHAREEAARLNEAVAAQLAAEEAARTEAAKGDVYRLVKSILGQDAADSWLKTVAVFETAGKAGAAALVTVGAAVGALWLVKLWNMRPRRRR